MRFNRLANIFKLRRLQQLKLDFKTPYKALLASAGVFANKSELIASDNSTIQVDRSDLPVWQEYFAQTNSAIRVENGLFHVYPHNKSHNDYFIKGCSEAMTYKPKRLHLKETPALIKELQAAESGIYSQHGEEGVILTLLNKIGIKHKYIVEFGAHDAYKMSNSRYLITEARWRALLIEANPSYFKKLKNAYNNNQNVSLINSFVTKQNINTLFKEAGVPEDFDVLSIDVDGPDYYLWEALSDFTPSIVIIEYNSSKSPDEDYVVPEDKVFELGATSDEGASLLALYKLGQKKGYQAVYTELYGANLFFVHHSLAAKLDLTGIDPVSLYQPPQFGEIGGTKAPNGRGYK